MWISEKCGICNGRISIDTDVTGLSFTDAVEIITDWRDTHRCAPRLPSASTMSEGSSNVALITDLDGQPSVTSIIPRIGFQNGRG